MLEKKKRKEQSCQRALFCLLQLCFLLNYKFIDDCRCGLRQRSRILFYFIYFSHATVLLIGAFGSKSFGFLHDLFDGTDHVEGHLGDVVKLAVQDRLESFDGLLEWNQFSLSTCEHLGDLLFFYFKILNQLFILKF